MHEFNVPCTDTRQISHLPGFLQKFPHHMSPFGYFNNPWSLISAQRAWTTQPGAVTPLKDNPGFPTRICPLPIATQQELEPWDPLPQPYWSVTWLVLVIQIPNSWDPQPCHTALPCTSPSPSSHIFCVLYFGEVPWALGMYWMQLANSREMQTFKHICFNWEFPRSL